MKIQEEEILAGVVFEQARDYTRVRDRGRT